MDATAVTAGAQVSSLRPYLQTREDLRDALHRLAEMGYRTIQMQWWNPEFEPEFVAQAVRDAGLLCVSTQDLYPAVRDDFERTVRLNELCGGTCICVSGIPSSRLDRESVLAFSDEMTDMALRLAPLGMTLAFHPRAREWAPIHDASTVTCTDLLLQNTPDNVTLGLDLYHSGKAGLAPETLLHQYAGRIEFVHFKDFIIQPDGTEVLMPLGQGQTDWSAAVVACKETCVRWAFAEQERWQTDAFDCMRESLRTLCDWGFVP